MTHYTNTRKWQTTSPHQVSAHSKWQLSPQCLIPQSPESFPQQRPRGRLVTTSFLKLHFSPGQLWVERAIPSLWVGVFPQVTGVDVIRHLEETLFLLHQVGHGFGMASQYLLVHNSCLQTHGNLSLLPNGQHVLGEGAIVSRKQC